MKKQMKKSLLVIICMLAAGICYSCNLAGDPGGKETGPKLVLEQEKRNHLRMGREKLTGQEGREEMLNGASAEAKTQLETRSETTCVCPCLWKSRKARCLMRWKKEAVCSRRWNWLADCWMRQQWTI